MKTETLKTTLFLACAMIFFAGCENVGEQIMPAATNTKGSISLGLNVQGPSGGRSGEGAIPTGILITIKDSEGQSIKTLEHLTLVEVSGSYVTFPIELDTGHFTIEDFIVTDTNDTSIFITPKTGSGFEDFVSTPLPFEFEVSSDEIATVALDVVSSTLGQASDFGYANFTFNVVDPQAGLVAYYPFNGNPNDESGNGNDGTNNGATLVQDRLGNENSAYEFVEGFGLSGDYIEVPLAPTLEPADQLTVSFWTLVHKYQNTGIVTKRLDHLNPPFNSYNFSPGSNGFNFGITTGGTSTGFNVLSFPFPLNTWHHVVGVYDGNSIKVYVDGILENTAEASGEITYSSIPLRFGNASTANHSFDGVLDEVRIYNRALKSSEIKDLYDL